MTYSRTFSERGVTCCDETHCIRCVFGAHFGLEVGHGGVPALGVAGTPFGEETDRQAAEHPQDPNAVSVSDTALIFVGGRIETLM